MKYVYIVNQAHTHLDFKTAILGVHSSRKRAFDHVAEILEDRRWRSPVIEILPIEGPYPPGIDGWPELRIRQVTLDYQDKTSERIQVLRWTISKSRNKNGERGRGRRPDRRTA